MSGEGDFAPFDCAAILGVGLMGGSLGRALRTRKLARRVIGMDRCADTLAQAQALGAIDAGTTEAREAVLTANLLVVAAPVGAIPPLLEKAAPYVRPDALVTDIGSTKGSIVTAGEALFGERFVGGHPMAGGAESGVGASRADLFEGAAWAVVRSQPFVLEQDSYAARLAALATALGARPLLLDAIRHDRLVALISHLPHVLSFAFAATVETDPESELARTLAGGSYRDLMRVSAADKALWRDIFLNNRDALLAALAAYETNLHTLKRALETADAEILLTALPPA